MLTYSLKMPPNVYAGEGCLLELSGILTRHKAQNLVIFTDKGIRAAGLLELALEALPESYRNAPVLDDLPPEPTYSQVQKLVDQCRALQADFILAVGGGSVIDTAKLSSLLMDGTVTVRDLLDDPLQGRKCCPVAAVPTTAGTGAEATPNAIVAVPERELKIGIVNPAMISDFVLLEPRMIRDLPRRIAAATGVDAMAHAIECYTSNKATPLSDTFALHAFELIMNNIVAACDDPNALEAKANMLIASFFAGVAITASGTTAVHALSYPLGGKYHIAHGVSNAMLLTPVLRFNQCAIAPRLAEAYDRCFADGSALTPEEKADRLIGRMEQIVKHLAIPTSLKEFGVPAEDLEGLVEAGMSVKRLLNNNVRVLEPADARAIYSQIL